MASRRTVPPQTQRSWQCRTVLFSDDLPTQIVQRNNVHPGQGRDVLLRVGDDMGLTFPAVAGKLLRTTRLPHSMGYRPKTGGRGRSHVSSQRRPLIRKHSEDVHVLTLPLPNTVGTKRSLKAEPGAARHRS